MDDFKLTSGPTNAPKRAADNAIWSTSATIISMLVGLVALPILYRTLGQERLGIFSIAAGAIGFMGLLDLGIGRALTVTVSTLVAKGGGHSTPSVIRRALKYLGAMGVVWGVLLWGCAPFLARSVFDLDSDLQQETTIALWAVAAAMPAILVSSGVVGVLEGFQAYRALSKQRALLSILQFGGATLISFICPDVGIVVAMFALTRIFALAIWLSTLRRLMDIERYDHEPTVEDCEPLAQTFRFGGWVAVSNITGAIVSYVDRFYLASLFPPAAVTTYTAPYDTATRISALPAAAMGAVLPSIASVRCDAESGNAILTQSSRTLTALLLPVLLIMSVFAGPLLGILFSASLASDGEFVLQVLLVGLFFNCQAHVPLTFIHALGRSDVSGRIHLLELAVFSVMLVGFVTSWGIVGAALAYMLRAIIDCLALLWALVRIHPQMRAKIWSSAGLIVAASAALATPLLSHLLGLTLVIAGGAILICLLYCMRLVRRMHPVAFRRVP